MVDRECAVGGNRVVFEVGVCLLVLSFFVVVLCGEGERGMFFGLWNEMAKQLVLRFVSRAKLA